LTLSSLLSILPLPAIEIEGELKVNELKIRSIAIETELRASPIPSRRNEGRLLREDFPADRKQLLSLLSVQTVLHRLDRV